MPFVSDKKNGWISAIMKRVLFFANVLIVGFVLLSGCVSLRTLNEKEVLFEIRKGENFNSVVKRLREEKIIKNSFFFTLEAKFLNPKLNIKYGVYEIGRHEKYSSILKKFFSGKSFSVVVTIPEGYNIFDIASLLESKKIVRREDFLNELKNPRLLSFVGLSKNDSLEGYLYPDTYSIPSNFTPYQIILIFLKRFKEVVDEEMLKAIKKRKLTLNEVLTMASIVEKEAKFDFEKPIIAGVYYNRLKLGYKLQADPTLIYALILNGSYTGNIKKQHFSLDSKYNTYKYRGLPPSPICNPDKTSILAAIFPAKVDYLYFVAKPDGTHYFSRTLAEHNRAVMEYQIKPAIERRKMTTSGR